MAALAVGAGLGASTPAPAQGPGPKDIPEGYQTGYHIVRPGENLRRISDDYLGSQELWEVNWRLNPEVTNPDFLLPGQRLLVLVKPQDSVPSAQVVSLAGRVEGRPVPIGWNPARRQDLVVESDGMRTFAQSSAALDFHDGTSLVMTEDSIVFLKRAGRTLQGIETRSVEIVEGQADLASVASAETRADIEIVIGVATATPRPGARGAVETRLRKSEAGAAQLMVYEGESRLAAGGASIAVPEGMGSSVPEGGPPQPPEKLLPKPALGAPAPDASLELGRLEFSWEAVAGAAGYTLEVCSDTACEALVARVVGLGEPRWQAEELPLGNLFWRVTATSASGLDGYPAATRAFVVEPTRAEFAAPTASFALAGISTERSGQTYYRPSARVLVEVEDPSGVAGWQPLIDGRSQPKPALEGPWSTGWHRVAVVAEDGLGNRGETTAVAFLVDGDGPEIRSRVGGTELLEGLVGPSDLDSPRARWWLSKAARRNAARVRKNRPPAWTLVGWGNQRIEDSETFAASQWVAGLYRKYRRVRVTGASPWFLILAPGVVGGSGDAAEPGLVLAVEAEDGMAGVEELEISTVATSAQGYRLEVTARDRLGNTSRASLDFGSGG